MIPFSRRAERQLAALLAFYEDQDRPEAQSSLIAALNEASARIEAKPGVGIAAPRPYPTLAQPGRAWIKTGRYWVLYGTEHPVTILAIFYDTANIPNRI